MSRFLEEWDRVIDKARRRGCAAVMLGEPEPVRMPNAPQEVVLVYPIVARTMHPSFMAVPVPKHDPERDQ